MSPEREEAERLLLKAREDQMAVERFAADAGLADSVIGFHAQQAVEKALKAVLAGAGGQVPWTHDLRFLLERLDAAGVSVPDVVREGRRLMPWAVEFRYGEVIEDDLDRDAAVRLVRDVVEWAAAELSDR